MTDRTAVYRLYDSAGDLLYVGITQDPEFRWAQHASDKRWWSEVAHKEITWHPDRVTALKVEATAIRSENPRYNIQIPNVDGTLRGGRFRREGETIALALSRPDNPFRQSRPATHGKRPIGRPATGQTPLRHVRVSDDVWEAAKEKAGSEGRTVTDVIIHELTKWVAKPPDPRRAALDKKARGGSKRGGVHQKGGSSEKPPPLAAG